MYQKSTTVISVWKLAFDAEEERDSNPRSKYKRPSTRLWITRLKAKLGFAPSATSDTAILTLRWLCGGFSVKPIYEPAWVAKEIIIYSPFQKLSSRKNRMEI